ncbi:MULTISPECIES: CHAD domain-containing protein [unclassified Streptomyces]|uniref:CHAD domain-containing protein n=1 Tax=unclassified Streptomyces TaxID=2593676 RepID=UPI0018F5AEB3|nr:CHAD domain-containing protein [Streptomyces sp. DSM 110735]MBJ7905910.1 CHAD domain-containing protein [Streptomyces sp. DSM 110735]
MAPRHPDPADSEPGEATGEALAAHLRARSTEFLRALRLHRETGNGASGADGSAEAARALRRSARRVSAGLYTFRGLLEPDWADETRAELAWVSGTLGLEHACAARLDRLLLALHRLSGTTPAPAAVAAKVPVTAPPAAPLTVGAARAAALLDRRLTLARARAHSTALEALGSARFHALADRIAVLASDVPLAPGAAGADLGPYATAAEDRLTSAVAALPLVTAGHPYNAQALADGLSPDPAPHSQDGPWHQVRLLLRLHRYAREVPHGAATPAEDPRLRAAGHALNRHRDAAEAAVAAAQAARTARIAPATAYALGVLHADQRHEVEAARFAFQQAWQRRTVPAR